MSQVTYRANLSAKSFPFLSQNWGRTVIVPQYDNTFSRQLTSQEDPDKDVGIPQIYYCHNVMPHSQGFQSIGYRTILTGAQGSGDYLNDIKYIQDSVTDLEVYIATSSTGDLWAYKGTGTWFKIYNPGLGSGTLYTAAVNGTTYIRYRGQDWTYDFGTDTLTAVVYTGLAVSSGAGICAAAGYLIVFDGTTVYWSSTISATDFVPSLITGAGSLSLEAAKGPIIFVKEHNLGFFIYTQNNVIAALYTGNSRYPFQFREIVGADGLDPSSGPNAVAADSNTTNQYAYTSSGLQAVSSTQAQTTFPEVTDFLSGKLYETYDEATRVFSTIDPGNSFFIRLNLIASRYLTFSYTPYASEAPSATEYTHVIVYDLVMSRWGKLKINHTAIFQHHFSASAKDNFGVLLKDGSIKTVDFDPEAANSSGVLMLGKYQFVRPRLLQLDEINVENVQPGATFDLYDLVALDGKNGVVQNYTTLENSGLYRKLAGRGIGINHSLVLTGSFFLTSLVLTFSIHGKR
jgi:hypothetical protein